MGDEMLFSVSVGARSVSGTHDENHSECVNHLEHSVRNPVLMGYAVTCFEKLMSSFDFLNVTYDLCRSFDSLVCSSFCYNQKHMHIFNGTTSYCYHFRGAQ